MAFLRDHRGPLAALFGLTVVVDVVVLVALSPLLAGLLVGVFDASIAWWLVLTVVQVTGGGPRWMGGQAEEWTAEELKGLKRSGWQHIDHVPLVGSDVDHVVVGPGGVFVLETKWSGSQWRAGVDGSRRPRCSGGACQRPSHPIRLRAYYRVLDVVPLVVLWGRHEDASRVSVRDGVTVLHETELVAWLRSRPSGELTPLEVGEAIVGLSRYVEMHDRSDARHGRESRFIEDGAEGVTRDIVLGTFAGFAALAINMALWSAVSGPLVGCIAALALAGALLARRRWPTASRWGSAQQPLQRQSLAQASTQLRTPDGSMPELPPDQHEGVPLAQCRGRNLVATQRRDADPMAQPSSVSRPTSTT